MSRFASFARLCAVVALLSPALVQAQAPCEEWAAVAASSTLGSGDSGIGGTGRSGEDSGIGGTGIYGTITAFSSVCVNGMRVHYDEQTQVGVNDQAASFEALRVGQVVWIRARTAAGRLQARSISALSAVIGPITQIDAAAGSVWVAGDQVHVSDGAILLDEAGAVTGSFSQLRVGDVLDVSGLRRRDQSIDATRIQKLEQVPFESYRAPSLRELLDRDGELQRISVEGHVTPLPTPDLVRIAGLSVNVSLLGKAGERFGTRVWMTGEVRAPGHVRADGVILRPLIEHLADPGVLPPRPEPALQIVPRPEPVDPPDGIDMEPPPIKIPIKPLPGPIDRPAIRIEPRIDSTIEAEPAPPRTLEPKRR